jgi:hypothetical protein
MRSAFNVLMNGPIWAMTAGARLRPTAERHGWLLVLLPSLLLAYLLVWQRGLYADDYAVRTWIVDPATGDWRSIRDPARYAFFPLRPLAIQLDNLLAALLMTNEAALRALAALGAGVNSLLLAALALRLTGSRLVAVVSGWLFSVPLFAFEAVLWTVGNAHYVFPTTLALLSLHAYCRAVAEPEAPRKWTALATIAFTLAVASIEQFVAVAFLVPFLPGEGRAEPLRARLRRRVAVLAPALLVSLLLFGLYASGNRMTAARGGLDASLVHVLQRVPGYATRLWLLTLSPEWGLPLGHEAWGRGAAVVSRSWAAFALIGGALAALLMLLVAWRGDAAGDGRRDRAAVRAVAIGALWLVSAYVFPSILIRDQASPSRLLYFPMAGASLAAGGVARLATRHRAAAQRAALAASAGVLIGSAVCMVGYASAYAERSRLDLRQLAALRRAVPPSRLPPDAWLVPVATDERLFGVENATSRLLSGVFETPWSTIAAVGLEYRRTDVHAVAGSRWSPLRFALVSGRAGTGDELRIQGVTVPIERTVMFTYRDGSVLPIPSVSLEAAGGDTRTVRLPASDALGAGGGAAAPRLVVAPDGSIRREPAYATHSDDS